MLTMDEALILMSAALGLGVCAGWYLRAAHERDARQRAAMTTDRDQQAEQDRARRGEPAEFDLQSDRAALINAAHRADWVQVALNVNHGPPCFHVEGNGRFCLRAETWAGHGESDHDFVPLSEMIAGTSTPVYASPQPSIDPADRERAKELTERLLEECSCIVEEQPQHCVYCEAAALLRKAYLP